MEHTPMTTALQEPQYARLERSGNYMYHLFRNKNLCLWPEHYIYLLFMILTLRLRYYVNIVNRLVYTVE